MFQAIQNIGARHFFSCFKYYILHLFGRFEFVKAAGTSIVPVNLLSGQQLNGKILKHIAGTGPVFLRVMEPIHLGTEFVILYFECYSNIINNP